MTSTKIGPFRIAQTDPTQKLIWPLVSPDNDGDISIHVRVETPTLNSYRYELGLIEFVTKFGNMLLQAIVFGHSGPPEDFAGDLPEMTIVVGSDGKAQVSFFGEVTDEYFDALDMLRQTILMGDAELLPIMKNFNLITAVQAPIVGFPLGVRPVNLSLNEN